MYRAALPKALALVVLTSGLSLAGAQQTQTTPPPDQGTQAAPMGHHQHSHDPVREAHLLGKKLNLTDDQTAKLEPILADRNQKIEALQANQQLSPEDRHQQMKAIHQSTHQQMAAILSPDQMEQLKQMRRMHRGQHSTEGSAPVQPS